MVLDAWVAAIKRTDDLFHSLTDEQLLQEVAPGRNRGVYLLGHLAAVHDRMLPLLGFGNLLYPELSSIFLDSPDKAADEIPSTSHLRSCWNEVNATLWDHMRTLTSAEWFQQHNAVKEEDFAKEPHRNRLNIILNRTNHLTTHLGQLIFLKPRETNKES
jgi:hypothetical protein